MCGQMGARGSQKCQHTDTDAATDAVKKTVTKAWNLRNIAAKYVETLQ